MLSLLLLLLVLELLDFFPEEEEEEEEDGDGRAKCELISPPFTTDTFTVVLTMRSSRRLLERKYASFVSLAM